MIYYKINKFGWNQAYKTNTNEPVCEVCEEEHVNFNGYTTCGLCWWNDYLENIPAGYGDKYE